MLIACLAIAIVTGGWLGFSKGSRFDPILWLVLFSQIPIGFWALDEGTNEYVWNLITFGIGG